MTMQEFRKKFEGEKIRKCTYAEGHYVIPRTFNEKTQEFGCSDENGRTWIMYNVGDWQLYEEPAKKKKLLAYLEYKSEHDLFVPFYLKEEHWSCINKEDLQKGLIIRRPELDIEL